MNNKVIVLGGGIAGMSAAHELAERGFEVEVYELRSIPGGKARSMPFKGSGKDGRKDLPGEHGFRFFPRFYKHVTDTMKRIPYKNNRHGVYDNLSQTSRLEIAQFDKSLILVPSRFPRNLSDWLLILKDIFFREETGLTDADIEFFGFRTWQLITSCKERRLGEYEKIGWWDYVDAENRSEAYQNLLAKGITTSLVASRAKLASTKTMGDIFLQLFLDIAEPGISSDLLLNGPTNEVWIDPWLKYLQEQGVDYHLETRIKSINCMDGKIASVTLENKNDNKGEYEVQGDYYIAAVPVEIMGGLITDKMIQADSTLENIQRLSVSTAWMNGIQFYLKEDVPVTEGHVLYVDTPWALTSISQKQFWKNIDLSQYGDGQVKGIISAIASDWGFFVNPNTGQVGQTDSVGIVIKKRANEACPEEIKNEVWAELKKSLNVNGQEIIKDENLHSWFLDPDIVNSPKEHIENILDQFLPDSLQELYKWILPQEQVTLAEVAEHLQQDEGVARNQLDLLVDKGFVEELSNEGVLSYRARLKLKANINAEPLLVNLINTWNLRPHAYTRIPNFFLASDYVRTNTDLATMEGANEAARRAVNAIIDASGVKARYCKIWDLHEPWIFALWRWHDHQRYKKGLPWDNKNIWYFELLQKFVLFFHGIVAMFRGK